jgi:hypothetical protein
METKVYCWLLLGCLSLAFVSNDAKPIVEVGLAIDPVGVGLLGAGLIGAHLLSGGKGGKGTLNLGLGFGKGGFGGLGGALGGLGGAFNGFGGFSLSGIKPPRISYPFFLPKPKTIVREHHIHVQPHVSEILVHQKGHSVW